MGTTLRTRLLLGLALAVVLPFLVFWLLGMPELRARSMQSLGRHLLTEMAARTAENIGNRLELAHSRALTFCATSEVLSAFSGENVDFRRFHTRVSELHADLGDLVLVSSDGSVLFQKQAGSTVDEPKRTLEDGPLLRWLAAMKERRVYVFAPEPNPLEPSASVSAPHDPEQYVLPLVVPIIDDTERALGACFFLLPFSRIQDEIENTRRSLAADKDIASGEVYLVDRKSGRYLLHTERGRIGTDARLSGIADFVLEEGGKACATSRVDSHAAVEWSAGVRVDAAELFGAIDELTPWFLALVGIVLAATVGIATLASLAATRSLGKLERATEKLGAGNLEARADVAGPREVRKLADAVNSMAAQLEVERERLKVAERDRAWTAMARQVAHEIKNPLQPVKLHAELVARLFRKGELEKADGQRGEESARVILRQVDALQKIVQDFSDYAQAATPIREKVRFRASDVVQELVQLYSVGAPAGAAVEFHDTGGEAHLLGSPLRLQQVLVNLIKNAIEAHEAAARPGVVQVTSRTRNACWIAEIEDRGKGLPAGGARQAFEPSFSTKPGGTGLGLAVCQRNVDAMGGRLELREREGGGVLARVEIPLAIEVRPQ